MSPGDIARPGAFQKEKVLYSSDAFCVISVKW